MLVQAARDLSEHAQRLPFSGQLARSRVAYILAIPKGGSDSGRRPSPMALEAVIVLRHGQALSPIITGDTNHSHIDIICTG